MAIQHPLIDHRALRDITQQILGDPVSGSQGLRGVYTPHWDSRERDDPGTVLSLLFGKLMEIVLERLNRIPEKNFIAFLDLLGIDRLPGNPARTPVKFFLPVGNKTGGFAPAGTQVSAGPTESGTVHIFETEKGLFITPVSLKKIFSLIPAADRFSDISLLADSVTDAERPVGSGETLIEHSLYLANDTLLGFSEPADLTLDIEIVPTSPPFSPLEADWQVVWERYVVDKKGKDHRVEMEPAIESPVAFASQFLESGRVVFKDFPGTAKSTQGKSDDGGGEAHWIRARLKTALTPKLYAPPAGSPSSQLLLPQIEALQLGIAINRFDLTFDAAFYNAVPIDLSKDFHPFGTEPKLADTFYLASNEAFSKPGATITLRIRLSKGITTVAPSSNLELLWESGNGLKWQPVENLHDGSDRFSKGTDGVPSVITFNLPKELAPTEVNGVSSHWIRVRIVQGNYGEPAHYEPKPSTSPVEYEFVPDSFHPPVLSGISLEYDITHPMENPQKILTFNNFHFQNRVEALSFYSFEPHPEKEPALYMGFDKAFEDKPISLFFYIVENLARGGTAETTSQVTWEYSNNSGEWARLELIEDGTHHLTTAGTVSFIGPDNFASLEQFQHNLFWLRARFQILPANRLIKGIHLNTVQAANLTTITDEILGSGNGKAGQSVSFSQKPVLPGEQVYVREQEVPSDEAREALEIMERDRIGRPLTAEEKNQLVQTLKNSATGEEEIWVRWQRVDKFFGSAAQSRHYVLDRINGVLSFGDEQAGMLPPIARDNIKAFFYQSGGGLLASKEVKAGVVKELRSFSPFVDKVINLVDASGGSDPESVEDVLERGPQTIKNRDRAVTIEDFVWLAKQASTLVHQVKCLPTRNNKLQFEAGAVTVLLVPDSEETQPRPSQELIRTVKDYLLERCLPIIKPTIYVIPPLYKEIRVTAEVVAIRPEESGVVEGRILNGLNTFLHPVKGGPKKQGWDFGRNIYISEIHQLIEDTAGVDVVLSVVLNNDPSLTEIEIADNELPVSGVHDIIMKIRESDE